VGRRKKPLRPEAIQLTAWAPEVETAGFLQPAMAVFEKNNPNISVAWVPIPGRTARKNSQQVKCPVLFLT